MKCPKCDATFDSLHDRQIHLSTHSKLTKLNTERDGVSLAPKSREISLESRMKESFDRKRKNSLQDLERSSKQVTTSPRKSEALKQINETQQIINNSIIKRTQLPSFKKKNSDAESFYSKKQSISPSNSIKGKTKVPNKKKVAKDEIAMLEFPDGSQEAIHLDSLILECPKCSSSFEDLYLLKEHALLCMGTNFNCIGCPVGFQGKNSLIEHYRATHPEIPLNIKQIPFCPKCSKTFKVGEALQKHITSCTSSPKIFTVQFPNGAKEPVFGEPQCPRCGMDFASISICKAHCKKCHL